MSDEHLELTHIWKDQSGNVVAKLHGGVSLIPEIAKRQARIEELEARLERASVVGHLAAAQEVIANLEARVAELEEPHPEWMKRIQRERREERERIIAHLGTAFLGFVAHDPEKHLFLVGTENVRRALESMP